MTRHIDESLTGAQLRRVALELQRWAARYAETDLAVSKFLNRIDEVRAEARNQARRERRRLRA